MRVNRERNLPVNGVKRTKKRSSGYRQLTGSLHKGRIAPPPALPENLVKRTCGKQDTARSTKPCSEEKGYAFRSEVRGHDLPAANFGGTACRKQGCA